MSTKELYKRKRSQGFTIIEVMIVLAIAGLILLIVLLAVPAVQRSSRNTTMKNDAAALAGGISEYESNNNGGVPASPFTNVGGTVTLGAAGTAQANAKINGSTTLDAPLGAAGNPAAGHLAYWIGHRCDGTASTRSVAIYYPIETSSGIAATPGCVEG